MAAILSRGNELIPVFSQNCQLSCYRKELLRRCNCVDTVLNKWDEPRCGYVNKTQGEKATDWEFRGHGSLRALGVCGLPGHVL